MVSEASAEADTLASTVAPILRLSTMSVQMTTPNGFVEMYKRISRLAYLDPGDYNDTMPSPTWDLALAELIYYVPAIIPVLYCLWKHRHGGISGWFFLTAFLLLQIVGSGLTLSAGKHGTPSSTAITITSVGLSPLILAAAGIMKEWAKLVGLLETKKRRTLAVVFEVVYHIAVIAAIAIYATGASKYGSDNADDNANAEWRTGIILLLLLWMLLCFAYAVLVHKAPQSSRALFWSILVSLIFIGIRVVYQCIATVKENKGAFNQVTGSIALRVIFQFLPGAFSLLALVIGGIMSMEEVAAAYLLARNEIEMSPRNMERGRVDQKS